GLSTQSEIQQNVISDPEITSTLFSAPLNTVAGPFNTGDALLVARAVDASDHYILPLSDSRVRPRIIDQLKREKALALAEKAAAGYQKRLAEAGPENFRDRAKEMEMIPFQTGFFEPGYQSFVPGFGYDMNFKRAAFALKYGDISEPVQVQDGYVIMRLVERRSGYLPSFEEAKGRVVDDIKYGKALKDLRGAAKEVAKDARDGEISQEALAKYNLRVQTADAVNRENIPSFLQQIRDPAEQEKAIERIIKGREGDVLAPLMLGDTYFVMWLPQVKESFIPDLDEVKNEVMLAYVRDKAKDAAYEELLREPPVRMDNVIVSEKAGPFTSEDLKTISQAADEGTTTIEKGNEIYYINNIRIDTTVVESMTEEERIKARENLHNEKFREFFYTWLENRRKESKIRVYIR
ncbi:MAG TPA: peptidyl-prolyl cis-trans isomerase, partial [Candidatus Mcinerneyibacteriales bacterium]|nr:peptidyl-prolyl cis-trans isomerase [Candidatus Mcinerneyibacteriales bacterium]